jgi:(1->4)-alpha-D-glucan 1-alpha-D-glucosylmutase
MGEGYAKLFTSWQALEFRKRHPGLCTVGEYLPAKASGKRPEAIFGFTRQHNGHWALVAIQRFTAHLNDDEWVDTSVSLSGAPAGKAFRNVLTGKRIEAKESIAATELFEHFPVALLVSE